MNDPALNRLLQWSIQNSAASRNDPTTKQTDDIRQPSNLDPELLAVVVDEVDYFLCWRSSSAPKKLAARFSISLVI